MDTSISPNIPVDLFENLYSVDRHSLRHNLKDNNYKFLGQGASRMVYEFDENFVIKISKNRTGKYQSRTENYIFNDIDEKYKKYFCPIVWYKENMIVMRKALPFTEMLGVSRGNIFEFTNIKPDSEFFQTLKKIAKHYDLLYPDIKTISSWGILDKKPVLIDYGCTNRLYDEYFY